MMTPTELRTNIDTIAIVMLENRSFDNILGHLSLPQFGNRHLEGLMDLQDPRWLNPSGNSTGLSPFPSDDAPFTNDIPHERNWVAMQLAHAQTLNRYLMNGFVQAYEQFTGTTGVPRPPPLGILNPDRVPVTGFLANEFAVCDHWHAPLPASTQPNRLMAMSGYTLRDYTVSGLLPEQDTVFDWLDRHRVPWRSYTVGIPFLTLMPKMWTRIIHPDLFRRVSSLAEDFARETEGPNRPKVLFIEPEYDDAPVHLHGHACDNHPPLPVAFGEVFLKIVYEALTSNKKRWGQTILIVTYDEHGGFFDHVPPREIQYMPPVPNEFRDGPFQTTGVRVPTIVASPFVERGAVSSTLFDHTSILQLLAERFDPTGKPYSEAVDARASAGIASASQILTTGTPSRVPPKLPTVTLTATVDLSTMKPAKTANQAAFAEASEAMLNTHGDAVRKQFPELAHLAATKCG